MLTPKDLKQIEKIVDERLEIKLEEKLETKLEEKLEEKLTEKLRFLPTKDEFYEKMDEVMGEIKAMREEQILISQKLSDHSDQLESHEERISLLEKTPSAI